MITIPISYYDKGYKFQDLTCVDHPLAAACGAYKYMNYFWYSGLFVLQSTFAYDSDWYRSHSNLLTVLGLRLERISILEMNDDELWKYILQKISNMLPLLFVVDEEFAFYIAQEDDGVEKPYHGVILSGVDERNECILINDCRLQADLHSRYMEGQAFSKFILKKNDILDLIRKSADKWKSVNRDEYQYLFSIEKSQRSKVNSWITFFQYWLKAMDPHSDILLSEIKNYCSRMQLYADYDYVYNMRSIAHGITGTIFNVMLLAMEDYQISSIAIDELLAFKEKYISARTKAMSLIQKYAMNHQEINYVKLQDLYKEIDKNNVCLFAYAAKILEEIQSYGFNLSETSIVTADSEQVLPNGIVREAKAVINGSWQNWIVDSWQSVSNGQEHWIQLDFGKKKRINRITIRQLEINLASHFIILISDDGEHWKRICEEMSNTQEITCYEIEFICRYVRYVVPTNEKSESAALWELDVFGKE